MMTEKCWARALVVVWALMSFSVWSRAAEPWMLRNPLPQSETITGMVWNGAGFLGVGLNETVISSPDGIDWTVRRSGIPGQMVELAWGAGQYVAVGGAGLIATSPDGVVWTRRDTASVSSPSLHAVVWNGERYVAAGDMGRILTSEDGVEWSDHSIPTTEFLTGVAWGAGQFVAVGGGFSGVVHTSVDGVSWVERFSGAGSPLMDVAYGNGAFVAVGSYGMVLQSSDGVDWSRIEFATDTLFTALAWDGAQFVATTTVGALWSSSDGVTWQEVAAGANRVLKDIACGGGRWVAAGEDGLLVTSGNGVTWEVLSRGPVASLTAATFTGSEFLVVSNQGDVLSSVDGVTWNSRYANKELSFSAVVRGGPRTVAVAGRFMVSSVDGVTWIKREISPPHSFSTIAWGNGRYVAVGSGQRIMVSENGATWTALPLSGNVYPAGVIWAGDRFIAGGVGGLFVSADGLSWQVSPLGDGEEFCIGLACDGGTVVAVMNSGRLFTSVDRVHWSQCPLPMEIRLAGVTWGGGLFLGYDGMGNMIASSDGFTWVADYHREIEGLRIAAYGGSGRFLAVGGTGRIYTGRPPRFAVHPISSQVDEGLSSALAVAPEESASCSLQWMKDDQVLAGATAPVLTITSAATGDAGRYYAILEDAGWRVPSATAQLAVRSVFDGWRQTAFTSEELSDSGISGLMADPDGDGRCNLMEYALGADPRMEDASDAWTAGQAVAGWSLDYSRPRQRPDLGYAVEVSTDLRDWSSERVIHERVTVGAMEGWRAIYPFGAERLFFRLRVTKP